MDAQRELYNAALEERRGAWRWEGRSVSRYEQFKELTAFDHPLLAFGTVPARGTLTRLDRAFSAFFRRCSRGERPGFPRFKAKGRFRCVEYGDRRCWAYKPDTRRVYFMGVGCVRFVAHRRALEGTPKTCLLRKEGRRWAAYVVFEVSRPEPLAPTGTSIGIDLGVEVLVATSDGELVKNPRHLRHAARRLATAQRLVTGRKRGSQRRRKAAGQVAAIHRKIANQRRDLHHHLTKALVARYDVIVHENLAPGRMTRRPRPRPNAEGGFDLNGARSKAGLNREILAAGWGQFLRVLAYKAEEAGRELVAVDPRFTSVTCHTCGHVDPGSRIGAVFRCSACGQGAHADVNAARNILRAGLALRREREARKQAV